MLTVGPLTAVRHDVLGLARSVTTVAGVDEVLVSPRAHLLDMPTLGQGVLGRHLMALAQRLGPGDFHSLRDYQDGDEPRSIHWRASARSENLKVRQHTVEGLRRCLVVLDQHVADGAAADEAFERAVTVAASLVHSADKAGLTTRFVTTDGADIRGPDVAAQSLHLLARISPDPMPGGGRRTRPRRGARSGDRHRRLALVGAARRAGARRRPDADGDRRVHAGVPVPAGRAQRRRPRPRTRSCATGPASPASAAATPGPASAAPRPCPRPGRRRDGGHHDRPARPTTAAELHRSVGLDAAATAGLALYSFVASLGYARVFADWQFVADVAVVVIVGHGLSFLLRRLRVPAVLAVLAIVVALVWTVAWLAYPTTFAAFVPTSETWNTLWADLGLVRDQFQQAVAPVEYVGGWSLLALIGTAFVVLSSDTFAFRAHARGEALVPGAVLFVFVAALGADRHRVALTLVLVAAGFLAAALLRVRFAQTPRTVLGHARSPLSIALPAVAVVGTMVVLGAWAIGPRLPGADADPLVETHNDGGGVTEVLSPLVDIRSRLVNRSATELFVVRATPPAYWRVSGLPEFDGRTWGLPDRSLDDVDGDLAVAAPGSTANEQEITISGLEGKLRPGARPSPSPPPARACGGTPRPRPSSASTATWSPVTATR